MLKAVTVVIPKGCAMIFSTWVIHCGAEWSNGDFVGYNRVHFYMTPFFVNADATSVNMHRRDAEHQGKFGESGKEAGGDYEISFSPALHFLPAPNNCSGNESEPPHWTTQSEEQKIQRLRGARKKQRR